MNLDGDRPASADNATRITGPEPVRARANGVRQEGKRQPVGASEKKKPRREPNASIRCLRACLASRGMPLDSGPASGRAERSGRPGDVRRAEGSRAGRGRAVNTRSGNGLGNDGARGPARTADGDAPDAAGATRHARGTEARGAVRGTDNGDRYVPAVAERVGRTQHESGNADRGAPPPANLPMDSSALVTSVFSAQADDPAPCRSRSCRRPVPHARG